MTKKIYGVDPTKDITAVQARDAIIRCFVSAHCENLENIKEYGDEISKEHFEKLKKINVESLIKKYFKEIEGNYKNPSKEDLIKICDKLAEFASNFREQKIIKKHYQEIMQLINKL